MKDERSMGNNATLRHRSLVGLLGSISVGALAMIANAGTAHAQMTDLPSDGTLATDKSAPPPQDRSSSPPPIQVITLGADGKPAAGPAPAPTHFAILSDDPGPVMIDNASLSTPELHVVRTGDTLWDICYYYFGDPWQWPKVWSYNPQITNPHWIYPGDLVRLMPHGMGAPVVVPTKTGGDNAAPTVATATPSRHFEVSLRNIGFVDKDTLDNAIHLDHSPDEKVLLAAGDTVYLSYPDDKPPTVGEKMSVYTVQERVNGVGKKKDDDLGAYVKILGEIQIVGVKKDKKARAIITRSVSEIERGVLASPLITNLTTVPPVAANVDAQGHIVARLTKEELIGQGEVVFIDLGEDSGLQVGNRMYIVRRGDGYDLQMGPSSLAGQDDRRFPSRGLGEVIIVNVGKKLSTGFISQSSQEMGVGDMVMMQKAAE